MRRLPAMIIVVFIYIGLFLIFLSWSHLSGYSGPMAKQGALNLENWNFERSGEVQLNGQWDFYPNQILSPAAVHAGGGKHEMAVAVPDNAQSVKGGETSDLSYGTYRLLIRSDRDRQIFGIQTQIIYSSSRLFMNGQLIGGSGNPSGIKDQNTSLRPYAAYFPIRRGNNELIIQVSKAEGVTGWGIAKPLFFGTERQIEQSHDLTLLNDLIMIVAFFIMGLYFLGYYMQRRKDLQLLFFSIFCLLFSVIVSWISPGRLIYLLVPGLSYGAVTVLESATTLFIGIATLLYLLYSYPNLVSKKVTSAGIAFSLVTLALDLLFQQSFLVAVELFLHTLLAIGILVYATYIFVLAIIKRSEGSIYLMFATLSMSVYIIITTISAYSSRSLFSLYSFSSILFLLMLSLLMSQRFSNAFKRSESLAQQLIRMDKLKDEFIAKTSHEFRTPLNAIINICQTLLARKNKKTISEEREKIELIIHTGYRLSDLVNDILDLSRMKQGLFAVRPVPVDVRSTVELTLAIFKTMAEKKNLRLVDRIPADLPPVLADENRFRQIVGNLVDNAIKYTYKGQITVSAAQHEEQVQISVADTGIGIPEASRATIFNAFQQAEMNASEGAGLGLSIVRQLIELQNGTIGFESKVGRGSIFHVTLPVARNLQKPVVHLKEPVETLAAKQSRVSLTTPYFSKKQNAPTILIVDDNIENLEILIDMLEAVPYNVIAVKDGQEALDIVARSELDLIILDLMMPGMTGLQVCSKIRERFSLIDLPVLMITAAVIGADKYQAFRAGANDILQKPYNYSEFAARIKGLILMKKSANQARTMEIAFLQSQIKPHFLYNVLNSIIALSYEDVEKSREMTAQFAAYLRGSFDFQNTSTLSSFRRELALVQSYLTIEQMRFSGRVRADFDIEENLDFALPPLMIQPLVENAVQYGIGKKKKGGRITLSVHRENAGVAIRVADDGIGMTEEQIKEALTSEHTQSVGLKNINQRLKHYYGTELQIESAPGKGTAASMHIPQK